MDLVSIGRIVGTHGYKGILKVVPLTDFPERFKVLKKVYIHRGRQVELVEMESVQPHRDMMLVKIKGIDSREVGQDYCNAWLKITEDDLYPLPEGYYYHFQLEGLSVYDKKRGYIGELVEILETGVNDVYVVNSPRYGEVLIPAIKEVIQAVDLDQKKMRVSLLPGLIEDQD
ncbi:ribosome maturation factor RimM [Syntrophomonas erecta]